jgi:hypothetical protein
MKKLILFSSLLLISLGLSAKLNPQQKIAGAYASTFECECLGVELDGSQTIRSFGTGRNRMDAVDQAEKNAVRAVIFKGISKGTGECNTKPLLMEVNAEDKYEDYFNAFFKDGGEYRDFISKKDGNHAHTELINTRLKSGSQATYRVVVRVLRSQLKEKLKADGIIK